MRRQVSRDPLVEPGQNRKVGLQLHVLGLEKSSVSDEFFVVVTRRARVPRFLELGFYQPAVSELRSL
eukprot:3641088-Pyramimonas_sp.AAC.1